MKTFLSFLLILGAILLNAQYTFHSTYYVENDIKYNGTTDFTFNWGNPHTLQHSNGFDISNYPLKLNNVKDEKQPIVIILEADIKPDNYDGYFFKNYGYRGFQIYLDKGVIIGVVEIIKSYYSNNIKVIKYL